MLPESALNICWNPISSGESKYSVSIGINFVLRSCSRLSFFPSMNWIMCMATNNTVVGLFPDILSATIYVLQCLEVTDKILLIRVAIIALSIRHPSTFAWYWFCWEGPRSQNAKRKLEKVPNDSISKILEKWNCIWKLLLLYPIILFSLPNCCQYSQIHITKL